MKSPLIHLVVAALACLLIVGAYGAWFMTVEKKSAHVADLEAQIATKESSLQRAAAARVSLAEIADDEIVMESYFVPETGVVSFINGLEDQGKALGSSVTVLSVAKSGTATKPAFIFSLSIAGTFDSVMRTIGAIEFAPYSLSVSTVSLAKSDAANWNAALTLSVGSLVGQTASTTP